MLDMRITEPVEHGTGKILEPVRDLQNLVVVLERRVIVLAFAFDRVGKRNQARMAEILRKGFLGRVPMGRLGEPADLAGPLLFLASRASDFYTGHILYADGGYTAG